MRNLFSALVAVFALHAPPLLAQSSSGAEVSLRLGGKPVALDSGLQRRLAGFVREMLARCGPNTRQHPENFGTSATGVDGRWKRLLENSHLRVRFAAPLITESHLGGKLDVSEALIGLEHAQYFVGPGFSRHGEAITEHLSCGYLPALEIACLAELAPFLPAGYREVCARFERDAGGRIVMPPPDIAPSCS